jgi:hypothetical protein
MTAGRRFPIESVLFADGSDAKPAISAVFPLSRNLFEQVKLIGSRPMALASQDFLKRPHSTASHARPQTD